MSQSLLSRITSRPEQCGGHPCIRGMRIRVADILSMLAGGATEDEILNDFPDIEREDIRAALAYASAWPAPQQWSTRFVSPAVSR